MSAQSDSESSGQLVGPDQSEPALVSLLRQKNPRIALRKETIHLLKTAGIMDTPDTVAEFCNQAIQHVLWSREATLPTLADLVAVRSGLVARIEELSLILLELTRSNTDLGALLEHRSVLGAFGEELNKLLKK
jgi:hypothetical protein